MAKSDGGQPRRWRDYTATLSDAEQLRLVIALDAGLHSARLASEVATENGELEDARRHVAAALAHLQDVAQMIGPPA